MSDEYGIDLDKERAARAAAREAKGQEFPIRLGGQVVATLPAELPLDALAPLRDLDSDITLLLRTAMRAARGGTEGQERWEATELVVDLLAANPALPLAVIDTVTAITRNLVGDDGYAALVEARLSREDVAALAKGVFRFYGLSLGESSAPSASPEGSGTTSPGTSSTTSDSTPEVSGSDQETKGSLEPVGS